MGKVKVLGRTQKAKDISSESGDGDSSISSPVNSGGDFSEEQPCCSRNPIQAPLNPPSTTKTKAQALVLMREVEAMFKARRQPWKYMTFLNCVVKFTNHKITQVMMLERVTKLLQGHEDLILGFRGFMPQQCLNEYDQQQIDAGYANGSEEEEVDVSVPSPQKKKRRRRK